MSFSLFAAILAAGLQAEAPANEAPAERLTRVAPAYPEACKPPPGEDVGIERVVVAYNVTSEGRVERARVRESTNACFDDTALATARGWMFEPRRIGGKAQPQEDLETTFTFFLDAETKAEDFDARPLVRVPPRYPNYCLYGADKQEHVIVQFDVTREGKTENISILESTYPCLNAATVSKIRKWIYAPKIIEGEPVERPGVQTMLTFILTSTPPGKAGKSVSTKPEMRKPLFQRLQAVEKRIRDDGAYVEQAFDDLTLIDEEFGDDYRYIELGMFHQVRAQARIKAHDFTGAIDDLKAAKKAHFTKEGQTEINSLIETLEQIVAAEDARAAAAQERKAASTDEP